MRAHDFDGQERGGQRRRRLDELVHLRRQCAGVAAWPWEWGDGCCGERGAHRERDEDEAPVVRADVDGVEDPEQVDTRRSHVLGPKRAEPRASRRPVSEAQQKNHRKPSHELVAKGEDEREPCGPGAV